MPTIAQRLAEVGYDTVGYTISYVLQHIRGTGRGFRVWETPWPATDWEKYEPRAATRTTDAGLGYLADKTGDAEHPYLLFLHYRCTHDPYSADPRWSFGSSPIDLYDSAAAYCDDELGRLLETLEKREDAGRTAVFIYSDHGELFGEHGFTSHGTTLFEPDVRVVLLARIPGIPNAPEVTVPVSLADLAPTTLMLATLARDPIARNAWSLLPMIVRGDAGGIPDCPIYLYVDHTNLTTRHNARGVLQGRMKYIHDLATDMRHLFDVVADPLRRGGPHRGPPAGARRACGEARQLGTRKLLTRLSGICVTASAWAAASSPSRSSSRSRARVRAPSPARDSAELGAARLGRRGVSLDERRHASRSPRRHPHARRPPR